MTRWPHIVFAVAGYAAIGMGHFYRALMFASEFADCRVSFYCTRESADYAVALAAKHYPCRVQQSPDLATDLLALAPDLVVNDLLDSPRAYMTALKAAGLPVVNFEDLGPGADLADLVINALYEGSANNKVRVLCGHDYFCLRDEFLLAKPNPCRAKARNVLLTFGGADPKNYTRLCLDALYPECLARDLRLRVVVGPGYAHKASLVRRIKELDVPGRRIAFTDVSNVMSREMQGADLAVCSAGRTVYELAHMRIPALVLAQHEREESHGFAASKRGFLTLGVQEAALARNILTAFRNLLDAGKRRELHQAMSGLDFTKNKARVVDCIRALLFRVD
ncbi:hypothetical protein LJB81_00580 [Desulfovibrio sp. OttesenSCG-928-M14]|nr:hypothetical protein [Desulfovibrio sp. OttesenSCG-928-M14]